MDVAGLAEAAGDAADVHAAGDGAFVAAGADVAQAPAHDAAHVLLAGVGGAGGVLVAAYFAAVDAVLDEGAEVLLSGHATQVVVVGEVGGGDGIGELAVDHGRAVEHMSGEAAEVSALAVDGHPAHAVLDAAVEQSGEAADVAVAGDRALQGEVAHGAFGTDSAEHADVLAGLGGLVGEADGRDGVPGAVECALELHAGAGHGRQGHGVGIGYVIGHAEGVALVVHAGVLHELRQLGDVLGGGDDEGCLCGAAAWQDGRDGLEAEYLGVATGHGGRQGVGHDVVFGHPDGELAVGDSEVVVYAQVPTDVGGGADGGGADDVGALLSLAEFHEDAAAGHAGGLVGEGLERRVGGGGEGVLVVEALGCRGGEHFRSAQGVKTLAE